MNMKTLLGTAAGLMVATGAYAADLPGDAAPAAVDYVKVCDAYGAGFFYIPGSETCLAITGRVRGSVRYQGLSGSDHANAIFRADGRVQFDARSASDFGTVRSFFEISTDKGSDPATGAGYDATVTQAFVQVGYVTVGRQDDIVNGDVFYGEDGFTDYLSYQGDDTFTGASVVVDNLGGGFYVGAGIYSPEGQLRPVFWQSTQSANLIYEGVVGIAKQSWGDAQLGGLYVSNDHQDNDFWGLKATANLTLVPGLKARLTGGYSAETGNSKYSDLYAAAAVDYQATEALDVYAGVRGDFAGKAWNNDANIFTAQIGANYALAKNLIATGEVSYKDSGHSTNGVEGILMLTRNF